MVSPFFRSTFPRGRSLLSLITIYCKEFPVAVVVQSNEPIPYLFSFLDESDISFPKNPMQGTLRPEFEQTLSTAANRFGSSTLHSVLSSVLSRTITSCVPVRLKQFGCAKSISIFADCIWTCDAQALAGLLPMACRSCLRQRLRFIPVSGVEWDRGVLRDRRLRGQQDGIRSCDRRLWLRCFAR